MRLIDGSVRHTWPLIVACSAILGMTPSAHADRFIFNHEHVLGTSLEIQVEAANPEAGARAEARVLKEIDRLAQIYSSYDKSSELSHWQGKVGQPTQISPELFEVLEACEKWQRLSHGAFNPAVQGLTRLWSDAEKHGQLPFQNQLSDVVAQIQQPQWTLSADRTATRQMDSPLNFNAIAKGAIIDRACAIAYGKPADASVFGILVCIGGDLSVQGDIVQPIHVVNPANDAVNAPSLATIHLRNRGLATSGSYRRGFRIGGEWYSHILDPRNGQPVGHIASATVVANTAAEADALATIFSVLTPTESATLAGALPGVEYLLVQKDGLQIPSPGWNELKEPQLFRLAASASEQLALAGEKPVEKPTDQTKEKPAAKNAAGNLLELAVQFELDKPMGRRYRRPYVAIWLENADEFPVRTALLWMQTKQPGPRWHRDLLRWYRNEGVRKKADGKDLIATVSGATRDAGAYKAIFDGKDDFGKPLPAGKYTLFIEVAREHGTYQLIRHSMTLGTAPIAEVKLKPNVEIKSASVEYRVAAPAPDSAKPDGK